jgi:hypothetical protein
VTLHIKNGVAIIVSPTDAEMIIEGECISGRVKKIKILMKEKEINILQIYMHLKQDAAMKRKNNLKKSQKIRQVWNTLV